MTRYNVSLLGILITEYFDNKSKQLKGNTRITYKIMNNVQNVAINVFEEQQAVSIQVKQNIQKKK